MENRAVNITRRELLRGLAASAGAGLLVGAGLLRWRSSGGHAVVRHARPMLGTIVTITAQHKKTIEAERAVEAAFTAVANVDRVMSIHRMDSDISRVNAAAGQETVAVDPSLCEVLHGAISVNHLTDGAYDVACLPIMRLYGFYTDALGGNHFPSDRKIVAALDACGTKNIAIDHKLSSVGLLRSGAGIDLGSIGKGFAVDMAARALKNAGVEGALIDAGGNILAFGSAPDEEDGWRVAIRNPLVSGEYFETITLKNASVATSGNYEQSVVLDGRKIGHLFDLRNGHPSDHGLSATVVAKSAMIADALSTSAFVLGPNASKRLEAIADRIYFHGFEV